MVDYRKSFQIQMLDENTLKLGPVLKVYGFIAKEAPQSIITPLARKYPGFLFELMIIEKDTHWSARPAVTRVENNSLEHLFHD